MSAYLSDEILPYVEVLADQKDAIIKSLGVPKSVFEGDAVSSVIEAAKEVSSAFASCADFILKTQPILRLMVSHRHSPHRARKLAKLRAWSDRAGGKLRRKSRLKKKRLDADRRWMESYVDGLAFD